jgi:hypothetical protein
LRDGALIIRETTGVGLDVAPDFEEFTASLMASGVECLLPMPGEVANVPPMMGSIKVQNRDLN